MRYFRLVRLWTLLSATLLSILSFTPTNASAWQSFTVSEMSLEDKIGQLFITAFEGNAQTAATQKLIREGKVGGVIYYPALNPMDSPEPIIACNRQLQELAHEANGIPLIISVDQEGGRVERIQFGYRSPGNRELGQRGDPDEVRKAGTQIAAQLGELGFNFDLAPVVDLEDASTPGIINTRAFSGSPQLTVTLARAMLQGFESHKISGCLKHFPGHGRAAIDSHLALPVLDRSLQELWQCDLLPYRELVSEAPAVMIGHLLLPQVDPLHPATFSRIWIEDILRGQIGFEGLVITDSLTMEAAKIGSTGEVSLQAILAGNDLLLFGNPLLEGICDVWSPEPLFQARDFLLECVKSGRLSEQRVDRSVERILAWKRRYCPSASSK